MIDMISPIHNHDNIICTTYMTKSVISSDIIPSVSFNLKRMIREQKMQMTRMSLKWISSYKVFQTVT